MEFNIMIPILIVAAFAGTAIMIFAKRKSQAKAEDIHALAQSKGWRHDVTTDPSGYTRITQITSRTANWIVEERFGSNSGGGATDSTNRSLTWTDPDAGIPTGLAVMSLAMSDDKAANMERFLDTMGDGVMGQHMMKTFFGVVGDRASELDAVEATGAAGAILATSDAHEALLPIAFHEALVSPHDAMPKGAMPTIIRSPEGLQLNLKDTVKSPEQLEAMVQLGETLSAALKQA
ncbi:hypothetical protein [Gymnodinialimonas hymeniacidonis]|uniref:hypothetical protein n=1 Tax=Gymnodinialimonas hymeniacidonis TaxID=3126508 RepID=UPI0034C66CF7